VLARYGNDVFKRTRASWALVQPRTRALGERHTEGKAPAEAIRPLIEFKEYSWKPLSSYVHGGIHAVTRRSKGYPAQLLASALKSSNGLLMMAGMMLVILSGDPPYSGRMAAMQRDFADCCPSLASGAH